MAEIVLEKKPEAAKLRIYIGAAPGVGKTYHMLNDAYMMKHQQGVDVVIGLVESHGRKETEARIRDLEIVPQRVIPYRGVELKEMDVDAILARHPNTVMVDELAHTNVPGSKNRKRYEDVLELLDAGINVMAAVNIQHLETLNDAVNRSANTIIRETVPDNFLKRADEVMNIDITVDELRTRLRAGKIYAAEKVEQSLANFFRKGNLNMLRELALRTTARRRQRPRRPRGAPPARRVRAHGPRSGREGCESDRPQRLRRADPFCPTGEHLPRGLRAIGSLALGYSAAWVGAQPLPLRGSRRHGASRPDEQAAAQGLRIPEKMAKWRMEHQVLCFLVLHRRCRPIGDEAGFLRRPIAEDRVAYNEPAPGAFLHPMSQKRDMGRPAWRSEESLPADVPGSVPRKGRATQQNTSGDCPSPLLTQLSRLAYSKLWSYLQNSTSGTFEVSGHDLSRAAKIQIGFRL